MVNLANRRHCRDRCVVVAVLVVIVVVVVVIAVVVTSPPAFAGSDIAVVKEVVLLVVVLLVGMNDDGCGGDQHGVYRELLAETLQPCRRFHFHQVRLYLSRRSLDIL